MGTDVFIMSPLLPLIAAHFDVSTARAGLGVTVFAFAYAALAPVFGHYGDKHGRRMPIVAGLLVLAVGNAATAWAPSFSLFLLARLIAGGAAAAITPSVYSVTGDVAPPERRGAWLAVVGSGIFTALWSSAPLGSLLGYRIGWQPVFLILAAIPVLLAAGNFVTMRHCQRTARSGDGALGPLLADVLLTTFWSAALYSTFVYLGAGLRDTGHTPGQIAAAVAFYGVGMVTGGLSGGFLVDRWGPRRITRISCVMLSIAVLFFRQLIGLYVPSMIALFFFSCFAALYFPAFQSHLAHRHASRRGAALAWNNSALYVGITLGSLGGGMAIEYLGFRGVPLLSVGFALVSLLWSHRLQWDPVSRVR